MALALVFDRTLASQSSVNLAVSHLVKMYQYGRIEATSTKVLRRYMKGTGPVPGEYDEDMEELWKAEKDHGMRCYRP